MRAQLLQMLYSIRSERLLMEEMDYNPRWFGDVAFEFPLCVDVKDEAAAGR